MLLSLAALTLLPVPRMTRPLADLYVDAAAVNCATGTGTLSDPVCSVTAALALASPGDTIRIEPGTYVESISLPFDLDLVGTSGAEVTILDGDFSSRVLTVPAAVTTTVDGVTVRHGRATEAAGVLCLGNLTISNSIVSDNVAYVSSHTTARGGGIFVDGGTLTLESSTVSGNRATGRLSGRGSGGGILVDSGSAVLRNSTISDNEVSSLYDFTFGGGVFVESGTLTIEDCAITGNGAGSALGEGLGGGLFARLSSTNIRNTTISGNVADWGGGLNAQGGDVGVHESTISANRGYEFGGGLAVGNLLFEMRNSTVSGNTANRDGGINIHAPLAGSSIASSTITLNSAFQGTGGVISVGLSPSIDIRNSIIAGNFLHPDAGPLQFSTNVLGDFNSLGHNLIDLGDALFVDGFNGDQIGSPMSPIDASLGPLQDNGGPTLTHLPLPASPAIDAGDAMVFETLDQRGQSRPLGSSSDIGSVESPGAFNGICLGNGGVQPGCTECPCGNNAPPTSSGGCLNSAGTSAQLGASGAPSVSLPQNSTTDLRFSLQGAPPTAFCVLISGDAVASINAASPCFGLESGVQSMAFDGLRCAVSNTRRHGGRAATFAGSVGLTSGGWGGESAPPAGIASAGAGFTSGQTRYFQVTHRENSLASCMRGLNTSQALEITFTP